MRKVRCVREKCENSRTQRIFRTQCGPRGLTAETGRGQPRTLAQLMASLLCGYSPSSSRTRGITAVSYTNLDVYKRQDVLYSVHLKATMMKVSDPILFGHVVKAYFADVFEKHGDQLAEAGLTPNNGLGSILAGLDEVDVYKRQLRTYGQLSSTVRTSTKIDMALAMAKSLEPMPS